ncbi:MAG: PQQ-binding-like beta-propeller repeat protein [Pirellulaceae bacterium]
MNGLMRLILMLSVAIVSVGTTVAHCAEPDAAERKARSILEATGVGGGLVVQLGCGDGTLTAALRPDASYLVHGLDTDAKTVSKARAYIRSQGLYGPVSVSRFDGKNLPYVRNTVNLLIVSDTEQRVSRAEIDRVLAPRGVVWNNGEKRVKPWPADMDEWTHYLHDPTNNAVAEDLEVGPPHHLQWVGGPKWDRSHEHLASMSAAVSSGGRLFYIIDEGPTGSAQLPPRWRLVARDAFSGVILWKRRIPEWENHLRGFRSGPVDISRRLVAVDGRVYLTPGYGRPVVALDADTGETMRVYRETEGTCEILCTDGNLFLVAEDPSGEGTSEPKEVSGGWHFIPNRARTLPKKHLMVLDAETGDVIWKKDDAETADIMPSTLAVAEGSVFFQNEKAVFRLDRESGEKIWRTAREITTIRPAYSAPTLVVHDSVVISADRNASVKYAKDAPDSEDRVTWVISSMGGRTQPGRMIAYSAEDGQQLWESDCKELYNANVDVLIANDLIWTGNMVQRNEPGMTTMRNVRTGEVEFRRPEDKEFINVGMYHHRCYRNKATSRYALLGRVGVEFVDMETGELIPHHWVRGECAYGILPCNGLIYAPPHPCACYIRAKLSGFNALAAKRERSNVSMPSKEDKRLEKGPAYGKVTQAPATPDDWPTFRANPARDARGASLPGHRLDVSWTKDIGGKLSSLTAAGGKVYVASVDQHTIHALDATTGSEAWSFTAGGRVDSPPTWHEGYLLFGSSDGYVYCVSAEEGTLAWQFRAAPADMRLFSYGALESVWPVHGSILVQDGTAWFAAGRSSYIDGGIHVYRLDAVTGELLSVTQVNDRDPETGLEPQESISGFSMEGALPDILSYQAGRIFMRHRCFDTSGDEQDTFPHMFSPAGYLDDTWWHRTYWIIAKTMGDGWGGWPTRGGQVPSGRLLVANQDTVYGYGRSRYYKGGGHLSMGGTTYRLFSCKHPEATENGPNNKEKGDVDYNWTQEVGVTVRGMLLAGDRLLLAGAPDPSHGKKLSVAALEGGEGGLLECRSASSGERLSGIQLDAMPVFDGLIAAGGRLYLSNIEGEVVCISAEE